jgi:preprotein translocase subunit YajC
VLISSAYAQSAAPGQDGPSFIILMVGMLLFMYFIIIRPQQKRSKELKAMAEALQKGDEVVVAGGLLGKITKVGDNYITLEIASGTEVHLQKGAVQTLLPKGTIKGI